MLNQGSAEIVALAPEYRARVKKVRLSRTGATVEIDTSEGYSSEIVGKVFREAGRALTHTDLSFQNGTAAFPAPGYPRKMIVVLMGRDGHVQLLVHVVLTVAGIVLVMSLEGLGWRLLGPLIATYGALGVGCNTHTSTRYATSDSRWVNEALSYFGYLVFLGLSLTFWWQKHVVIHHPAPNVIGVDGDVDLMPWFALTAAEVGGARGLRRFYYEHVPFWIFPVALVNERIQRCKGAAGNIS